MKFYNLKAKAHEDVPDSNCTKVVYGKGTNKARYAVRGVGSNGAKLTKFVNKATFDSLTSVPEVPA